ncbi:MAG TPA: MoaD/ThiS family protein [Magnetospirillaceae bacterium]|nr:MoaD/ThiS family protein [Magnetospirillaceae bacterium]
MESPRIRLRLFASLLRREPAIPEDYPLSEPKSIRALLLEIGVPEREAAIIFLNGRRSALGDMLADGDEVRIFPLIGGG